MTTQLLEENKSTFDWAGMFKTFGPLAGLIFVYLLFTALVAMVHDARPFATVDNLLLMIRQTGIIGIATLGMTMVIISGGIDLSVGSVMALSGVVIAQLLVKGWPATAAALGGIAAAGSCGLLIGLLITKVKLSPFIVSLGMWGSVRGAAELLANNTDVPPPVSWKKTWLSGLLRAPSDHPWMLLPAGIWAMLLFGVLVAAVLRYTRIGRHIFAIGSNEQTARLCGVNIDRTKMLIYIAGSAFAGIAGLLELSYSSMGNPSARNGAELDVIAAVVIGGASLTGGQGSIFGSLIGALIMTIVANGCTKLNLPNSVQKVATGAIIILAVALGRLGQAKQKT